MTPKEQIKTILNDIELAEVQQLADNPTALEAIKKIVLLGVYFNGTLKAGEAANPTMNAALALAANAVKIGATNEQVGGDLRAFWEGVQLVQAGFDKIAEFKSPKEAPSTKDNPGR